MKLYQIFCLLFFLSFSFYAQKSKSGFPKGEYSIISTTGINLRDAPNVNSNILKKLPFATKVEITENKSFGIDTIGQNIFYRNGNEKFTDFIIGNWVKVKYKNLEGYLFDAYLGWIPTMEKRVFDESELNLNKDFILLFQGNTCHNNFWPVKNMNWIGVYQKEDHFEFKRIELSYYNSWNDNIDNGFMDIASLTISTNDNQNLLFILGSKKKIKESVIKRKLTQCNESSNFECFDKFQISGTAMYPELILKSKNKQQVLNASHHSVTYYNPTCLFWQGDLDQDGELDYIISYGEKSISTYLYLSSEADEKEIVKPVAIFFDGYCC